MVALDRAAYALSDATGWAVGGILVTVAAIGVTVAVWTVHGMVLPLGGPVRAVGAQLADGPARRCVPVGGDPLHRRPRAALPVRWPAPGDERDAAAPRPVGSAAGHRRRREHRRGGRPQDHSLRRRGRAAPDRGARGAGGRTGPEGGGAVAGRHARGGRGGRRDGPGNDGGQCIRPLRGAPSTRNESAPALVGGQRHDDDRGPRTTRLGTAGSTLGWEGPSPA